MGIWIWSQMTKTYRTENNEIVEGIHEKRN